MDADDNKIIDDEAIAEEEFVADLEDTIENPLVYDGEKITVQNGPKEEEEVEGLPGAIGTGGLVADPEPFNNENALRSESVNNDGNMFGADPNSEKSFRGPDTAPLDNASETMAPVSDSLGGGMGGDMNTPGAAAPSAMDVVNTPANAAAEGSGLGTVAGQANGAPAATPFGAAGSTDGTANATFGAGVTPATDASGMPTTAAAGASATNPADTPKKKKKTGLIIGIILILLLIAAVVGGVVFYNIHESKEKKLSDAVSGFYSANARQLDGKVTLTFTSYEQDGAIVEPPDNIKDLTVDFKVDNGAADFSGSGHVALNMTDGKSYSIAIGGAYISNDGIYVMIDNIGETVKNLDIKTVMGDDAESFDDEELALIEDVMLGTIGDVASVIDGKWYKINADTFGSDEKMKDSYECITKAIGDFSSDTVKKKIADIYAAHPFIVFDDKESEKADGLTYFYVKADEEEGKAFEKDIEELNEYKNLKACVNKSGSSLSRSENNAYNMASSDTSVDESVELELPDVAVEKIESNIKLGITDWTHELRSVKGDIESSLTRADFDMKISYEKKNVAAPVSDASDITKAYDDVMEVVQKSFRSRYLKYGKKVCEENTKNKAEYNECYKEVEETVDIYSSFLGNDGIIKTSAVLEEK